MGTSDRWAEFLGWCELHRGGEFFFRGQAENSPILPKIARAEYKYSRARERNVFNNFQRRARPHLTVAVTSDWEWIALAQHHGVPTRLIDWTRVPLIAAWFAVSSFPHDTDAVIYALESDRHDIRVVDAATGRATDGSILPGPLEVTDNVYLMQTSPVSSRITTQSGLFTLHCNPLMPLPMAANRCFGIPRRMRRGFEERLAYLGIDAAIIYPDLDGLGQSLDRLMRTSKSPGVIT